MIGTILRMLMKVDSQVWVKNSIFQETEPQEQTKKKYFDWAILSTIYGWDGIDFKHICWTTLFFLFPGFERVLGEEAIVLPSLLLLVQRWTAGNLVRNQGPNSVCKYSLCFLFTNNETFVSFLYPRRQKKRQGLNINVQLCDFFCLCTAVFSRIWRSASRALPNWSLPMFSISRTSRVQKER